MRDFLSEIAVWKREELERRQAARSLTAVRAAAESAPPPRDFAGAVAGPPVRLIAEIKRVSPAKGALNPELSPAGMARTYAAAGAHALSVLTDERYFHGSDADLREARDAVELPVLRKDFVISPYQIYEARAMGADAVLLIARMLGTGRLAELHALARTLGMAVLVEIHTAEEGAVALAAGCSLVGINNRDLATFRVDIATTARVRPTLPQDLTVVSESGIATAGDVRAILEAGATAILVGEALVTAPEPAVRIGELLGAAAWSR